jgi:hypothetical protein
MIQFFGERPGLRCVNTTALKGGGIAERAAPLSPYAIDLERSSVPVTAMTGES